MMLQPDLLATVLRATHVLSLGGSSNEHCASVMIQSVAWTPSLVTLPGLPAGVVPDQAGHTLVAVSSSDAELGADMVEAFCEAVSTACAALGEVVACRSASQVPPLVGFVQFTQPVSQVYATTVTCASMGTVRLYRPKAMHPARQIFPGDSHE
eukprot:TRINITY_DN51726_c0_g1_i1.p1 TRINITY_DN51726_c0_g1~~TRINITY_DN51726_c0_g1_i1.p1  ORF type:complete len:153 (-),score=24.59 TRINITY_DN51726_c0_g1_i1:73-531(-)